MNIQTKYDIGQLVVGIRNDSKTVVVWCPECGGSGTLDLVKGGSVTCRECYGRRQVSQTLPQEWRIVTGLTAVGQIRPLVKRHEGFHDRAGAIEIEYMIAETGVGSGQIWYEPGLWPSIEEAQAECDLRNAATPISEDSRE